MMLTDLDQALTNAGVPFVPIDEHPADATGSSCWQERGRPASTGDFTPQGTLCHHTASPAGTSDEAELSCLLAGNSEAPGPISSIFVGRSGTVYLLAAGRCNHGGKGMRPGVDRSCQDMNRYLLGIEAGNDGRGEAWSDAQTLAYAQTVAALHVHYQWPRSECYLHATTGPPAGGCNSKIDPAGPWQREPDIGSATWNLETWRDFCVEQVHAPLPPDEVIVTEDDIRDIADRVWQTMLHNYASGEEQAAMYLLGFAHSEAFDGSLKREVQNMVDGSMRTVADMVRFAHYEAASANAKADQIMRQLGIT